MHDYPIVIEKGALTQLPDLIRRINPSQLMVFVDTHTQAHCYPLLKKFLPPHELFCIPPGEIHKNLTTCEEMWDVLTQKGFDRKGLVLNLGGGVLGDMGGFVAATFKRGVPFIQIPTTLLAQVDASVGGKLGIDFRSFKNHIGIFQNPQAVLIEPGFLQTLPEAELRSGFAEVIKHHLIADKEAWAHLIQNTTLGGLDFTALIRHSVAIKSSIVEEDYKEAGARKALNFGHTIGHAIESLHLEHPNLAPLLHGEAIAIGMVTESYIAHKRKGLSLSSLEEISRYILQYFPKTPIDNFFQGDIYTRMLQDKKNERGGIMATLVPEIGSYLINIAINQQDAQEAIDYYNSL